MWSSNFVIRTRGRRAVEENMEVARLEAQRQQLAQQLGVTFQQLPQLVQGVSHQHDDDDDDDSPSVVIDDQVEENFDQVNSHNGNDNDQDDVRRQNVPPESLLRSQNEHNAILLADQVRPQREVNENQERSQHGSSQQQALPSQQGSQQQRSSQSQINALHDHISALHKEVASQMQQLQVEAQVQRSEMYEVISRLGRRMEDGSQRSSHRGDVNSNSDSPAYLAQQAARNVKVNIQTFSGTAGEKVDHWVNHMEFVFEAKNIVGAAKVHTAVTALRKEPADWYYAMKLEDDERVLEDRRLNNWQFFKSAINEAFGFPETYDHYLDKLVNLKQGDRIQLYNNEFACLISKFPEMCQAEKRAYYIRGLRYYTQKDVKCKAPTTWQEARQLATLIESTNKSVKKESDRSTFDRTTSQGSYKKFSKPEWKKSDSKTDKPVRTSKFKTSGSKYESKKKTTDKKESKFKWNDAGEPICNKCGGSGHIQSECDGKTAKKQLN